MTTMPTIEDEVRSRRAGRLVGWGLLAGGAIFFIGGSMHPHEDPPDVTLKEHLRIMFEDPAWYPAHALVLVGMALIAASLVALARDRALAHVRRGQAAVVVAAGAAVLGAVGMVLHLVAAVESDRIANGQSTPIIDVNLVVETFTVPAFGFSMAALALVGALTRTLGNRVVAVLGILGGVGFGLAGATFLLTDRLDFLFPAASGIGVWSITAGIGLVLRARATSRVLGAVPSA
jgi:hypothetical protein